MTRVLAASILIALISLCAAGCTRTYEIARARQGELFLDARDFGRDGIVALNGEWEFYWNRLLEPSDFSAGAPGEKSLIKVPGTWGAGSPDGKSYPPYGCATYRLRVKLGDDAERIMGVYLRTVSTSYKLWINGSLLGSNGAVGADRASARPQYSPTLMPYMQRGDTVDVVIQVANFTYRKGGMWNPVLLGGIDDVRNFMKSRQLVDLFLLGSLLIMGLYHLTVFSIRLRAAKRDYSPLFFGLGCLGISTRLLATGNYYITALLPWLDFEWVITLEFVTIPLSGLLLIQFGKSLYPDEFGRRTSMAVTVLLGLLAAAIIALPVRIFNRAAVPLEILIISLGLYFVIATVTAILRHRENAGFVLAGAVFFMATVINDALFANRLIHTGDFTPLGLFGFTVLQSFVLARRFSLAFVKNEELTRELDRYARDLESKNRDLESLDRLKDEFMANTSHELRTPLTGIIGIAESIIDGSGRELSAGALHNLSLIVSSGKRLSSLINDILDFSRIKNSELILSIAAVDLYLAVDSVVVFSRNLCSGKDLALVNLVPHDFPPVRADSDRLQQVLFNLVGNAIKFTDSGTVEVSAFIGGAMASVTVRDSGIGIPPDKFDAIFTPFEQIDSSITRKYGGTGLGLSVTKRLVELHGGSVTVESRQGEGSAFTFTVPLAGDDERRDQADARRGVSAAAAAQEDAGDVYAPLEGGRPDVMVVDDEPVNVQVLVNHLRNAGYRVAAAPNGKEGLRLLDSARPDLIILDVMMPALSGYDVCMEIRKKYAPYEMPVLLLTAKNRISDMITGFESGANDYLSKPFDKREMMARVETLISLKRMVDDNRRLLIIENELDIARRIQYSLLPERFPDVPGVRLHAYYRPMQSVGGDIYDFISPGRDGLGMLIADVAGHGIPAALISSMVKMAFSLQGGALADTAGMLRSLNGALIDKCNFQFVTAGYAYIDIPSKTLFYSRAGHHPALIVKGLGASVITLTPPGKLLALFREISIGSDRCDLESGDTVFLFTDGLVECSSPSGELFGMERLIVALREFAGKDPAALLESLVERIREWRGDAEFEDDVTMVAARIE